MLCALHFPTRGFFWNPGGSQKPTSVTVIFLAFYEDIGSDRIGSDRTAAAATGIWGIVPLPEGSTAPLSSAQGWLGHGFGAALDRRDADEP